MIINIVTRDAHARPPRTRYNIGAVHAHVDLIIVGIDQAFVLGGRLVCI